jgi:BlaI family transcriptional regulator, penicillinase repressor
MGKKLMAVTETELSILTVLWEQGSATVREITEAIYRKHSPSAHATVKSLLERLATKGYVASDRADFAHQYRATLDRQTFVGEQLRQLAERHFGGSVTPMLLALVDQTRLRKSVRDEIRKKIEELE